MFLEVIQNKYIMVKGSNSSLTAENHIKTHQKPVNHTITGFFILPETSKYVPIRKTLVRHSVRLFFRKKDALKTL
jgi:hypothetical protein